MTFEKHGGWGWEEGLVRGEGGTDFLTVKITLQSFILLLSYPDYKVIPG